MKWTETDVIVKALMEELPGTNPDEYNAIDLPEQIQILKLADLTTDDDEMTAAALFAIHDGWLDAWRAQLA